VDLSDPGCAHAIDSSEADPAAPPACADGADNDEDGASDWPDDEDCRAAGDEAETPRCLFPAPIVRVGPAGGRVTLPALLGPSHTRASCSDGTGAEGVVHVTVDEPSFLRIGTTNRRGPAGGAVYVRTACDDAASELLCRRLDLDADLWLGPIPAGEYFAIVERTPETAETSIEVTITVSPAMFECDDGVDDDDDGALDLADPGCRNPMDDTEADLERPPPAQTAPTTMATVTSTGPSTRTAAPLGTPPSSPSAMPGTARSSSSVRRVASSTSWSGSTRAGGSPPATPGKAGRPSRSRWSGDRTSR